MRRKIRAIIALISSFGWCSASIAGTVSEHDADNNCIGHRDYAWSGDDAENLRKLVNVIKNSNVSTTAVEEIEHRFGRRPAQTLVTSDFVRVSWLLEASRKSERIDCIGNVEQRIEWHFAIIETEWRPRQKPRCLIYQKHVFDTRSRPDPYSSTSPLDSTIPCDSYQKN